MLVLYPHLHLALSSGPKLQVSPPESYVQNDKSQWEDNIDARDRPTNDKSQWEDNIDARDRPTNDKSQWEDNTDARDRPTNEHECFDLSNKTPN
jgi:hypothetical protein